MIHPPALQLSMHVDNALSDEESLAVSSHVASCVTCQQRVATLRDEVQGITTALQTEVTQGSEHLHIPKFAKPTSLRGFAMANLVTGLVIWLSQFLWKNLFSELIVNLTSRITAIYLPDVYSLASNTTLYLLEEGTAMLDAYLGFIIVSLVGAAALWYLLMYRKSRATLSLCVALLALSIVVVPPAALALELRRDTDTVTISESETIDDTLFVAAKTILIEGIVTGDLIAVGRRIDVTGSVEGNLITFAETITVRGNVGGLTLGAGSSYDILGAKVGGNLWIAGEKVRVDGDTRIDQNATAAAQTVIIEGTVHKDLFAFGETVELNGELGEDLEAFAGQLRLLNNARIGGNVRYRSDEDGSLYRAEGARIGGQVERLNMPEELEERNRYLTAEFYLWQLARLVAALLFGLALLWFVPGLRQLSIGAGLSALKLAGLGFLALVSVPVMAALVALTLVGVPLSLLASVAWLIGLYLAKIIVGAMIGRMLLGEDAALPLTLLLGLAMVIFAVNLPFIGGIINLLLTIIGFGLFIQYVIDSIRHRQTADYAPA